MCNISSDSFKLPYGTAMLSVCIPDGTEKTDLILPVAYENPVKDPLDTVKAALASPLGVLDPFRGLNPGTRVSIAVNDKTRPVPNSTLLPPLLEKLHDCGVSKQNIFIHIASGTHKPMVEDEYEQILDKNILRNYHILPHDCDDKDKLCAIGRTLRGTPVVVNQAFYQSDLKIVVGDIEPHHFAGYSGGVKSAAIGLSGRKTINANHSLMLEESSVIGNYDQNPLRQDIEEIGRLMKIDLALNAVLDENKNILSVYFGDPEAVMRAGILLVDQLTRVKINTLYDVVLASAGGYPKDINLYQGQKAMTHASLFCKPGGVIILVAECREGVGSSAYLDFMHGLGNVTEVLDKFTAMDFRVGPHKAYQVAKILQKQQVYLFSSIASEIVRSLFLHPLSDTNSIVELISGMSGKSLVVLPYATTCIPKTT